MATKKTQAAPRGGKAKPKTNASTGAPPGSGRASQVIGVLLMALGVFSGYLMWSDARELSEMLARLRDVLRGVRGSVIDTTVRNAQLKELYAAKALQSCDPASPLAGEILEQYRNPELPPFAGPISFSFRLSRPRQANKA